MFQPEHTGKDNDESLLANRDSPKHYVATYTQYINKSKKKEFDVLQAFGDNQEEGKENYSSPQKVLLKENTKKSKGAIDKKKRITRQDANTSLNQSQRTSKKPSFQSSKSIKLPSSDLQNDSSTLQGQDPTTTRQKWLKVDEKVTIVNGKLVYSQSLMPKIVSQSQLIDFLQKNGVSLKEYIYGDKEQIIQDILKSHEKKEKEEIQKYINKNMKEEEAVEMTKTQWYAKARDYLFEE